MIPGEWLLSDEPVEINAGRPTVTLTVHNTSERSIQIGSHYHFFEANKALDFDRDQALGKRLNVPAGQAVRFEPGETHEVELVDYGGARRIVGFNGLVGGSTVGHHVRARAHRKAAELGFLGVQDPDRTPTAKESK